MLLRACNRPFKKDTQTGTRIPLPSTPPDCIPGPIVARIDAATKWGKTLLERPWQRRVQTTSYSERGTKHIYIYHRSGGGGAWNNGFVPVGVFGWGGGGDFGALCPKDLILASAALRPPT
jgi:hypothetical protein